jgi:hypothetical protein
MRWKKGSLHSKFQALNVGGISVVPIQLLEQTKFRLSAVRCVQLVQYAHVGKYDLLKAFVRVFHARHIFHELDRSLEFSRVKQTDGNIVEQHDVGSVAIQGRVEVIERLLEVVLGYGDETSVNELVIFITTTGAGAGAGYGYCLPER